MKKNRPEKIFTSYDEYLAHCNAKKMYRSASKNRMFIKGEEIALAASRKIMQEIGAKKEFSF